MKRWAGVTLAVLAGCVLQTETVSGPKGEKGETGPKGSNAPWVIGNDGVISYSDGSVGIGTTAPAASLHVNGNAILRGASSAHFVTNTKQDLDSVLTIDQGNVGGEAGVFIKGDSVGS